MIAILDYGLGNLGSIDNMLKVIGEKSKITKEHKVIESADGIILPGVGAFDAGMSKLDEAGLCDIIKGQANRFSEYVSECSCWVEAVRKENCQDYL